METLKGISSLAERNARQASVIVRMQDEIRTLRQIKAGLEIQVDNWIDTARFFARGQEFYQGIVRRCGAAIGPAAYTSDDGTVQDDVLALVVPELVEAMTRPQNRFLRALRILVTGK